LANVTTPSGRLGTLNHDQIVILALETGRGKVLVSELHSPVRPASRNLYFLTLCHVDGLSYPESVVQSVVSDMTKEFMEIGKLAKNHKADAEHATDFDPPSTTSGSRQCAVAHSNERPPRIKIFVLKHL
jgi:hypothetical protein